MQFVEMSLIALIQRHSMFSPRSSQEVRRLNMTKSFVDFDFLIIKQIPLIRDVTHVFPETLPELSMSPTPPV